MRKRVYQATTVLAACLVTSGALADANVDALSALGKQVFFDEISVPARQSCATCHVPENGFTAGVAGVNKNGVAVPGANPHTVGNPKPPTAAYAASSPNLSGGFLGQIVLRRRLVCSASAVCSGTVALREQRSVARCSRAIRP